MNKKIVCYFSASGITKKVAENIATLTDSDLFEIEPVDKYTEEDLDWRNKQSRSSVEMQDKNYRPKVKNKISNINEYDTIILGFPVWWYTAPTIINTFIEENDFENKKVYIFVTSGSSDYTGSLNDLKNNYPNIEFIKGIRLTPNSDSSEITNWLK